MQGCQGPGIVDYVKHITSKHRATCPYIRIVCCSKDNKFVIFSDSISSLKAISGFKIDLDLVMKLIEDYTTLLAV